MELNNGTITQEQCKFKILLSYLLAIIFALLIMSGIEQNPGPFTCRKCGFGCRSAHSYCQHQRYHANDRRFTFVCCYRGCMAKCSTYNSLKNHIYRDHRETMQFNFQTMTSLKTKFSQEVYNCSSPLCTKVCNSMHTLIKHLREHLKQDEEIVCPFPHCLKKYTKAGTFSTHVSRYHKVDDIGKMENNQCCRNFVLGDKDNETVIHPDTSSTVHEEEEEEIPMKLVVDLIAKFYLKLEAVYLVPSSTVQLIAQDMKNLTSIIHENMKNVLVKNLLQNGLSKEQTEKIATSVMDCDILFKCHNSSCGTLETVCFETAYARKKYFIERFDFVPATEIYMGTDSFGKRTYCSYVPLRESLRVLLNDRSIQRQVDVFQTNLNRNKNVLSDFTDGSVFRMHYNIPNTIHLILYQDELEIVNPLGSAKNRHKVLAVYFTIGNLLPENRSKVDSVNLILLCKSKHLKHFDLAIIFHELLEDLKTLERDGILYKGQKWNCHLTFVVGDNLGSHAMGGFQASFSGTYFCRYCAITKEEFHAVPFHVKPLRTPTSYNQNVAELELNQNQTVQGVKTDSLFNKVGKFHVCNPGLPPCLGHDLFEGIVDYDMALYIEELISDKKWFSLASLNQRIDNFKYLGTDANNKPKIIAPNSKRLGGTAAQNWCFIRLFPLLVFNYVRDCEDGVWQQILRLRIICEFVCAPQISKPQVSYLHILIHEYLECRQELFENVKLRPKHHFLAHYPALILQFGPLIRCWTMRFESKHQYFKRVVRACKNFVNVTKSLASKHQLHFAYALSEEVYVDNPVCKKLTPAIVDAFDISIQKLLVNEGLTSLSETDKININGTMYEKERFLILHNKENISILCVGQIEAIFLTSLNIQSVMFLISEYDAVYCYAKGLYEVEEVYQKSYKLVRFSELQDYYCLPAYSLHGLKYLVLKHSILSMEEV